MGTLSWLCLIHVFFLAGNIHQVSPSGTFELRLISLTNLEGRDGTGGCCSGQRTPGGFCEGACTIFLRICVKHYQVTVDANPPCTFGEIITPILGNTSIMRLLHVNIPSFSNPIAFSFNFSWPQTFSLIVEAWHGTGSSDSNKVLVSRLIAQRSLEVKSDWNTDSLANNYTYLDFAYRVRCETNYYGLGCEILCRPRDDKFGHYTCRDDGEKICMPGWSGEYCTEPICRLGCHDKQGTCKQPQECICRLGWEGFLCDECTRYPGCLHGTCTEPWQCNCDEGWGGLFCNQDLNYCTSHRPCKNGGTCTNTGQGSYTCNCANEYMGTDCGILRNPCKMSPCLNGATCINPTEGNYTCHCALGYFGPHCETSASICTDNPCENGGTCVHDPGGFICQCPPTFDGPRCQQQVNRCKSGLCQNGGTCVEHSTVAHCLCPAGFHGARCEHVIDNCESDTCQNGGNCHNLVNDYSCQCKLGFTGKDCSLVDYCNKVPCLNGGWCQDVLNGFVCHCSHGYSGVHCEISSFQGDVTLQKVAVHLDLAVHPTSTSNVSQQMLGDSTQLSGGQVALIATVSSIVPLMALMAVAVILAIRRCRHQNRGEKNSDKLEDDEQEQNERNSSHMNNKCVQQKMIVNTLDRTPLKVTNEGPAKVFNTELSSNNLRDNKDLVCAQRTLDRRDFSGVLKDSGHQLSRERAPSSGIYVIEDHFRLSSTEMVAEVLATEV